MDLNYAIFNGIKVVALPFVLEALTRAHEELVRTGVTYNQKLGFTPAGEVTASWRSLTLQKQLVAKGASKTLYSNHRRGTAVDAAADWNYINKISPILKKYGLVNDLAYLNKSTGATSAKPLPGYVPWDGGHFNWQANEIAADYEIIDEAPLVIKQFSMNQYDNKILFLAEKGVPGAGSFAAVYGGEKHIITPEHAGEAAIHPQVGAQKALPVTKATWDSIPTGHNFAAKS